MRIVISAEGKHVDHAGRTDLYRIAVDGKDCLVDLNDITGTLHDPTILRVQWGPRTPTKSGTTREGGQIFRTDGSVGTFWEKAPLKPYLHAWAKRWDEMTRQVPAKEQGAPTA